MSEAINSEKLDALIESTDEMTESNNNLALAMVEYQERAKTATRRFRITLCVLAAFMLLFVGGIYVLLLPSRDARDTILDCVQPTGHCYKDGQQRTADVVGAINEASRNNAKRAAALAAACAPDYVNLPLQARIHAIQACINRNQ